MGVEKEEIEISRPPLIDLRKRDWSSRHHKAHKENPKARLILTKAIA